MYKLSEISVKRPIATTMIMLIFIAFSTLSIMNLKMDLMPNMNIPVAIVYTSYSGAGPEEIENLVTIPVEQAMGTVQGIDEISSSSSNGSSIVIVQFQDDVDIDQAALDMREKIDLIKGYLPDASDDPMVMKIDINSMSSIMVAVRGEHLSMLELKTLADDTLADRLERQDGVASVSVVGGREKEISIILQEEKMRGYGINETTIRQLLAAENLNTPTGTAKQGDLKMQVRVKGEFETLEEIRNLPLQTATGATLYLRDIATVEEAYKEKSSAVYVRDTEGLVLSIDKQSTANTVNVSDAVIKELDRLRADYPDMEFTMVYDPADYIRSSISGVMSSLLQGMALSMVVLYVFLRNYRSTLIIATAMPLSVIITIGLMYFFGITMNLISLSGLALGVGMLVDNSVVVLESIYRKLEEGYDSRAAAIDGAKEVVMPVLSSTLTTVAVFVPIAFVGGIIAQVFNDLSFTISCSLFASYAVAITFVPMCCALFLSPEHVAFKHKSTNFVARLIDKMGDGIVALEAFYHRMLKAALNHRRRTIALGVAFVVLTMAALPFLGMELMPNMDQGMITGTIEMPAGTLLEETEAVSLEVMTRIMDAPEIDNIEMLIGGGGVSLSGSSTDTASIYVILVPKSERKRSTAEIVAEMRTQVNDIPGATITMEEASGMGSMGSSSSVSLYVKGNDLETLIEIAEDVKEIIENVPGTREVKTSADTVTPQATIKIDRLKAAQLGITPTTVASYITTAIAGSTATTYKVDGTEYDVVIRQEREKLDYIVDIENLLIPSNYGVNVPLSEIGDIYIEDMPETITRDNQSKYISVSANLDGRILGDVTNDIQAALRNYPIADGYSVEFTGSADQMNEAFSKLGYAMIIAIVVVYMIMAAQFESVAYPLIVMFSIPIACTGGLMGLVITRQSLTMSAFLGMIMLVGVVVNNAIVLIDYANLLRRERGMQVREALEKAGPMRLRPILMSTLTTVISMIPLALAITDGGEMSQGLAIVNIFGLALSTMVTLILIPVIYSCFESLRESFKARRSQKKGKQLHA